MCACGPQNTRISLSLSSDQGWSCNTGTVTSNHRGRSPHEHSLDSNDSGTSIDTQVDIRGRRAINAFKRGRSSSSFVELFTDHEENRIRESLRRKLLSNDGARLSRIEKRLCRADRRGNGVVRVSVFEDSLAAEANHEKGASVHPNEALWLIEKLKDRNGRKVAVFKIRAILESGNEDRRHARTGVRPNSHTRHRHRERHGSRDNRSRRSELPACRGRNAGGDRRGREGGTSESDSKQDDTTGRSSHPARWAVRQGTVGQWLYEAASPMVSFLA